MMCQTVEFTKCNDLLPKYAHLLSQKIKYWIELSNSICHIQICHICHIQNCEPRNFAYN